MIASLDKPLLAAWVLALAFGAVMVSSSSVALPGDFLQKHAAYIVAAIASFSLMCVVPLIWWRTLYRFAWLVAIALCVLVLVPGIGIEANGSRRWIGVGSFTIQPSEWVKLFLVVYLAGYLARFDGQVKDRPWVMIRPLLMLGPIAGLLLVQPDFGSVVVLGGTACGMLFIAGARLRHFLLVFVTAASLLGALAVLQPYRMERLISFTDPWAFAFGSGYQLTQSLIAFGRGEIFGLGLGEGIQKLFYLPEAHNDFIFAVIGEELGLVGAVVVICGLSWLVLRVLRTGRQAHSCSRPFTAYLCYGTGLVLGMQMLINLGVSTGVLPTKGLTLPFISYGGNSIVVCSLMLGLVMRGSMEMEAEGG
ncbi:MAG: putative lipid II flippase FtsW [Proteobacteria bacterium]|nr:putative lipid II flippase FtsW [Pseudomonadota bacterium]